MKDGAVNMEEKEVVEYIILENGKKYYIAEEKNNYVLLVNSENEEEFCIRKNVVRDGEEFIETLDSDQEFDEAAKLFAIAN